MILKPVNYKERIDRINEAISLPDVKKDKKL